MPFPMKANYLLSFLNERTSTVRTCNGIVLLRGEQGRNFFPECSLSDRICVMTVRELGCRCGSLDRS